MFGSGAVCGDSYRRTSDVVMCVVCVKSGDHGTVVLYVMILAEG
jgi:hypothetical protein